MGCKIIKIKKRIDKKHMSSKEQEYIKEEREKKAGTQYELDYW